MAKTPKTDDRLPHERPVTDHTYDWGNMRFIPMDAPHAPGLNGAFLFEMTPEGVDFWWNNRHSEVGHRRWGEMTKLYHEQNPVPAVDPAAIVDAEPADDK